MILFWLIVIWTWTGPQRVAATVPLTVSVFGRPADGPADGPAADGPADGQAADGGDTMPGAAPVIGGGGAPPRLVR